LPLLREDMRALTATVLLISPREAIIYGMTALTTVTPFSSLRKTISYGTRALTAVAPLSSLRKTISYGTRALTAVAPLSSPPSEAIYYMVHPIGFTAYKSGRIVLLSISLDDSSYAL